MVFTRHFHVESFDANFICLFYVNLIYFIERVRVASSHIGLLLIIIKNLSIFFIIISQSGVLRYDHRSFGGLSDLIKARRRRT